MSGRRVQEGSYERGQQGTQGRLRTLETHRVDAQQVCGSLDGVSGRVCGMVLTLLAGA